MYKRQAVDSVVNISSTRVVRQSPFFSDPFFRDPRRQQQRYGQSLGSGVIVSTDGYILTNNHVVKSAKEIRVTLTDGREIEAKLVGSDPKSDLAVLKFVDRVPNLRAIRFGNSDSLRLAEFVIAIGNPFGVGQTVTMGIVSAKGRGVGVAQYEDFIQTDAAINPGNSGGALINLRGELIGINTAILSKTGGYQGIGFAIPSKMVEPIMRSLINDGRVTRGYLGVSIQPLNKKLALALGIPYIAGVVVSSVEPGGPADLAGLRRGDVIAAVNGRAIRKVSHLQNVVAAAGLGARVKIDISRHGRRDQIYAKLESQPDEAPPVAGGSSTPGAFGANIAKLDRRNRNRYQIPRRLNTGVLVTQVDQRGIAAGLGVRPGDVIMEVNRRQVSTPKEFRRAYNSSQRQIALLIYRDGSTVYLAFTK